jgi:mannose-6-phosphate isomerase-like protein (cupin superfamily)
MATLIDAKALTSRECSIIKGGSAVWGTPSSSVESIPAIDISLLGLDVTRCQVATSVVTVRGRLNEELHYHRSHVIGLGVKGSGILRTASPDRLSDERRLSIVPGDIVLIPRGALHLFETEENSEFVYVGLEFSDEPIDYQSHRYYASDPKVDEG